MVNSRLAVDQLVAEVVGRRRESELVVAALSADRHVLLEGPPGTGKSTLLRGVASALGVGFEFVEGTAELTPSRLIGHFDPALVLVEGYSSDIFVDGPLVRALRQGSLLYVEEINRVPEETLNALVTVMSEREVHVPRLGRVAAEKGFRLVAAMNPFDAVGTARIAGAVYDRVCRVAMDYQSEEDERAIVAAQQSGASVRLQSAAVEIVRATRSHPDLRTGSSVRGAIDLCMVSQELGEIRSLASDDDGVTLDAALVALSGRVRVREGVSRSAEEIVKELWQSVFHQPDSREADPSAGKATSPTPASRAI
ncbi:MAG: AAA family ATPase [Ilumatobacteraceae bacterium]